METCVPKEERITMLHDSMTILQPGMAKTIVRMARLYYWPDMFQDITEYVRRCPTYLAIRYLRQNLLETCILYQLSHLGNKLSSI